MNIGTASLLNLLTVSNSKIDNTTKATIENLSVNGKVDISSLAKEKSVQTLLSGLFKDIIAKTKNNSSVNDLLKNSKHSFDFKSLSNEVKNISKLIEQNPKLEKQSSVLKEFLVNIKNLDENVLKSNIKNSGVFLESKLLKSDTPLSQTIKTVIAKLDENIEQLTKNITKSTTQPLAQNKTQNTPLIKQELLNNIKSILLELQGKNISADIKANIQNITNQIKTIETNSYKTDVPTLKELNTNIKSLDLNISKENILDSGSSIKKNIKLIMSTIQNQLDSNVASQKASKNTMLNSVKNAIVLIQDKVDNIKVNIPESLKSEIKADIGKVFEQIKTIPVEQTTQKTIPVLKELQNSIKNIEFKLSKIDTSMGNNILSSNSILNSKSIVTNDLKAVILQVQERIQTDTSEISKEVKLQIDKIQTQIEFYQLLSYTSTSNHTFLPFSWDDLEDADIKFDTKDDDSFSCQINLSLKEMGELKVLLQLDDKKNLNINVGVESSNFKQTIQQNLQKLRVGITSVGLMVQSLNVFDIQDKNRKTYEQKAYGSDTLNFGLDIKA
ncbi:MAG: flagellar hook-length control protein FliK [Campylobacterota bacterium]|nr:flagellar hook-length control protein FliK [Campylobacterota bacterium]